ncbi:MAG: hypothetical protein H7144_04450 [Burkholderiales bacterium]|nr:hypothetical protein [Phycisphaerae bacterium]
MNSAPLNVFQKTQRLWDTLHPYNAAQAAELTRVFSRDAIEDTFNAALNDLRLGVFVCEHARYRIDTTHRPRVAVTEVADFATHVGTDMNRPFDPALSMPFRPFVCPLPGGQMIGLTYQHWVADSVSVRTLMRAWVSRLFDLPSLRPEPVVLDRCGLRRRFGPDTGGWSVISQIAEFAEFARMSKLLRRVEARANDQTVAVIAKTLPPDLITGLRKHARVAKVTVGDVFIAATAEACARHGPSRPTRRRPDLALGTIVDLRARHAKVPSRVFGLYLGFMISAFTHDDLYDFNRLLARSRRLRVIQNRHKSAEASQLRMAIGLLVSRTLSRQNLIEFYRRRFPMAGGLSNVNLTHDWPGRLYPDLIRAYHRVSPTGPLMPIVLTPTTIGNELTLCCTYRTALANEGRANGVVGAFIDRLERFAG